MQQLRHEAELVHVKTDRDVQLPKVRRILLLFADVLGFS